MMVIVANEKCVMPDELAAKTGCWVLLFKRDTVDNADVARPSKSENNRGDEWSSVWFRVQGQFAPQNFFRGVPTRHAYTLHTLQGVLRSAKKNSQISAANSANAQSITSKP